MQRKSKFLGQIFFVGILAAIALLSIVMISLYADNVAAQEPAGDSTATVPISEETLEAFGLSADSISATDVSFDLIVNKTTGGISSITSGEYVTYTVAIMNSGTDNAEIVMFKDNYPSQMSDISFDFSQPATSDGHTPPTWLFDNPILAGETAVVTVTGKLVAIPGTIIENTAEVIAFGETDPDDNTDGASVTISGGGSGSNIIYLPMIFKAPPRVLLYSDNFSNDNSGWPDNVDTSICDIEYSENEYRVKTYEKEECWIPGPSVTDQTYAEYQISARVSSGDGDFGYGIYINGSGPNYYYLYRIRPDDECGWRLVREGNGDEVDSGGCHAAINRGSAKNNLKIIHYRDGKISIFVNDTLIHTEDDGVNGDLDGGTDMGLYVNGPEDGDVTVRFDDLRIYSVP